MKIGLLHNLYGAFSHGGAETVVEMMAADFRKAGHEVFLITTRPRGAETDGGKSESEKLTDKRSDGGKSESEKLTDESDGLKIYYLNSKFYNLAKLSVALRLFWHLNNILSFHKYAQIKKILRKEKPDLVMTHNLMGLGFMAPAAIRSLKIRHEHFLHDIQLLHPSGLMLWGQEKKMAGLGAKIYRLLTRGLFASPAKVTSPSRWLLNLHDQYGFFKNSTKEVKPFQWPVIRSHDDLNNPNASNNQGGGKPNSAKKSNGAKKFLFIGQIEEQKGIFLLINAFKKISNPDIKLTIAIRGGGQKITEAKQAASEDGRIKFFGPFTYEEVEKIKATSDCLIVPSLCYENSPTTIYGARAAGLRVIAANLGGIPEIIGPNDKLFRPGDEEDLRKKIKELVDQKDEPTKNFYEK